MSVQLFRIDTSRPEQRFIVTVPPSFKQISAPSYDERLFHNARENLRAYRETLRQKDLIVGSIYLAVLTALVLIVCFSL